MGVAGTRRALLAWAAATLAWQKTVEARQKPRRARPATLPLVVLDAGHGGRDPGAAGPGGLLEKRVTLAVTLELRRQLRAAGRCRVALTRGADRFVPLGQRVELARARRAALLLSLHADSAVAGGARGASVYTLSDTTSDALAAGLAERENRAGRRGRSAIPPDIQAVLRNLIRQETHAASERLARLLAQALGEAGPLLPNSRRHAGFVVLQAPDVPAALVELGFLSSPGDAALLARPAHRARLAAALATAIHRFLPAPPVAGGRSADARLDSR